ncbi:MAG: glutathione S-transferase family protein [Myxococcota bacterium]
MGMLIDGKWSTQWYAADAKGRFIRDDTKFRGWVTRDGSSGFPAEAGRYHLYASWACPWAHRTLIARKLRKLEDVVSLSVVDWFMGDDGWEFSDREGTIPDDVNGARHLRDVYVKASPNYTGRVTVPVLWDKQKGTIVNNESREILRMLDDAFLELGDRDVHFHPPDLHDRIEETIDAIYSPINNGVYRSGFASSQEAYDEAVGELFDALDHWEGVLGEQRWLCGNRMTEADICLFTTLLRFDLVYHTHFKCNVRRIRDYPNLWGFTREIYQLPGVAETCNLTHIKRHYFQSHESINPKRIVPAGPDIDFSKPHDRARLGGEPPL